jgi:hypothetical protein
VWKQRLGSDACGSGLSSEMHGVRKTDYGSEKNGGKKYKKPEKERIGIIKRIIKSRKIRKK